MATLIAIGLVGALVGLAVGVVAPRLRVAQLLRRAQRLMSVGEHREALLLLSRAIEARPQTAFAYVLRSQALFQLDVIEHALADADEAVRLAPKSRYSRLARARLYAYYGRHQDAVVDLQAALRHDPQWLPGYFELACHYLTLGDPAQCFEALRQLTDRAGFDEPLRYDAQVVAGWVYEERLHNLEAAIERYSQAIALAPERRIAYVRRAWAFRVAGAYVQAAEDLLRAGRRLLSSEDLRLYHWLSMARNAAGHTGGWMEALQRLLVEDEDEPPPRAVVAAGPAEPQIYLN